jgi:hypothetical protein
MARITVIELSIVHFAHQVVINGTTVMGLKSNLYKLELIDTTLQITEKSTERRYFVPLSNIASYELI